MDSTSNSDVSTSTEYSYSASEAESSTESADYSSNTKSFMSSKNSILLSHPSNQFGSSSTEDEEPPQSKKKIAAKATPLACGPHDKKKKEENDSGSVTEEDGVECDKTISISKVVSLDSLRQEVPMGSLKPVTRTMAATKETSEAVTPFSSMSATEIEAIALQQKASTYKTLASMNETELANVRKIEAKRVAGIKGISAQRPEARSISISSHLTPLATESPESFAEIKRVNEMRLTAMKSPQAYTLGTFANLSEEKKDAIFVSERKRLMSNFKPIDALSTKEFNALALNSTPFACPIHDELHVRKVDDLSLSELRELVQECRLYHDQTHKIEIVGTPLRNVMPTADPRKTGTTQAKLSSKRTEPLMMASKKPDILLQSVDLVDYNTLSFEKQKEIRANMAPNNPLVDFNQLPLEQQKEIRASIALNNQKKHLDSPLADFHSLTPDEQKEFRTKNEQQQQQVFKSKQVFTSSKSALSSKKEFDLKVGNSILSSPNVQTLYHNLSTANLAASSKQRPRHDKYKRSLMKHIKKAHPIYASLLKQHIHRRVLDGLLGNKERNFIFVVPTEALLAIYQQNGQILNLAQLATAYLTILLKQGEQIPSDNTPYSCANLLRDHRVNVRRIDDKTIMIDNTMVAKLDPASGGKVYKMVEPSKVEEEPVVQEITNEDSSSATTTEESKSEESQVSEVSEEEEEAAAVVEPVEEPKVIASLPAADANSLAIVPYQETKIATLKTELSGVYKNSLYTNRKIETLATKMLSAEYSGEKHMASYVDHSQEKKALNSNLFLKTFAYDELYDKYRATSSAMTGAEHLTPMDSFTIDGTDSLNYALDKTLEMKEFVVNTKEMKIRKGELINHFVVLTFKMPTSNDYANLSFTLPDETKGGHTDTYMSANENLLLKFKDNLLQSIVINTNASDLTRVSLAEPSRFSSLVAGKPLSAAHNISVTVPMNDEISARLYEKDLNYAQFLNIVMPLSAPSFFEKAKGLFDKSKNLFNKTFIGHKIMPLYPVSADGTKKLMKRAGLSMDTDVQYKGHLPPGKIVHHESTIDVRFGLANDYETPKKWERYAFNRATYRRTEEMNNKYQHVSIYEHVGDSAFNLDEMVNQKLKPTLTVKLSDPLNKGKSTLFRFNLPLQTKKPSSPQGVKFFRAAKDDDSIEFLFEVVATKDNAALQRLFVFFSRSVTSKPFKMQQDVAKFLATEAFAYKRLNLDISASHLTQRLNKLVSLSELTRIKTESREQSAFFAVLQKETENYMKEANLNILLADAPSTTLTMEKNKIIESSGYKTPLEEETKQFKSLMLSSFSLGSPLPTTTTTTTTTTVSSALVKSEHAKDILNSVIEEYATLSNGEVNTKDVQFALYIDRVRHISNFFKCALDSK